MYNYLDIPWVVLNILSHHHKYLYKLHNKMFFKATIHTLESHTDKKMQIIG